MSPVQTTIEPCEIRGEPSVEKVEITPAIIKNKIIEKAAVHAWLCAEHVRSVDRGWQRRDRLREKANSKAAKHRLARDQFTFDG